MPRPIPVFQFIFAAYAVTRTRPIFREPLEPSSLRQVGAHVIHGSSKSGLLASTSTPSAFLSGLVVKVRVMDYGASSAPRVLEPGGMSAGPAEDLWLTDIVANPLGFVGVVHFKPERLPNVSAGDSIAFGLAHILEWRHFDAATSDASPEDARAQ